MRGEGKIAHGNISARIPGSNDVIRKPTGGDAGKLTPRELSVVDPYGKPLKGRKPSTETDIHCAIYRARPEINGVIHVHAPYAIALSTSNIPIVAWSDEGLCVQGVPIIPRVDYDRTKQVNSVIEALGKDGRRVMIAHHGPFIIGETLDEALLFTFELEQAAWIQWLAYQLPSPKPISMEEAAKLGFPTRVKY